VTVVVGLVEHGRVWMASDSFAFDGHQVLRPNPHKVRRLPIDAGQAVIFGTCGAVSLAQTALYRLKIDAAPDPADDDDCDEWAYNIAAALAGLARDTNTTTDKDAMDGAALFAWRHRLWHVTDHCALPVAGFTAIGSGCEVALGALDVLHDLSDQDPESKVRRAVEAACRWEGGCGLPVAVVTTDGP